MVIAHDVSLLRHKSESVNGQRPGENIIAHLCESLSLGWWTFLGGLYLWSRGERFSLALEPNSTYVFIIGDCRAGDLAIGTQFTHSISILHHLKLSWQISSNWCWDVVSVGGKHHLFGDISSASSLVSLVQRSVDRSRGRISNQPFTAFRGIPKSFFRWKVCIIYYIYCI